MKLSELIHKAAAAYPDARLFAYWDGQRAVSNPAVGDTLAEFIVRELCDTFDATADTPAQCVEAVRVLRKAMADLQVVLDVFSTSEEHTSSCGKTRRRKTADQLMAAVCALHHELFVEEGGSMSALREYDALLAKLERMGYRPVTTLRFEPINEEDDDETT